MEYFVKLERFRGTREDVIKKLENTFLCGYAPIHIYHEFRRQGIITRDEYGMYIIHRCTTADVREAQDRLSRNSHKYYIKHKAA